MKPVFKPGDKVRLITDPRTVNRDWEHWANQQKLTVGDIYTVKGFYPHESEGNGVRVDGKSLAKEREYEWEAEWFELVTEPVKVSTEQIK